MAQNIIQPQNLPNMYEAIKMIVEWRGKKTELLSDLSPSDLFAGCMFLDPMKTWFTGSVVWYPMVLGTEFTNDRDIDIITYDMDAAEYLSLHIVSIFTSKDKTLEIEVQRNKHGGPKIIKNKKTIVDIWGLPENVSIAEFVSCYKHDHERVAVPVNIGLQDLASVTRLVRPIRYSDTIGGKEEAEQQRQNWERDNYSS